MMEPIETETVSEEEIDSEEEQHISKKMKI